MRPPATLIWSPFPRSVCASRAVVVPGTGVRRRWRPGPLPGPLRAVGLSSQLFHRCQRAVQALPSRARRACSEQEERLLRNVVASLAQALQELSTGFRRAQSGYLKRECHRLL